MLCLALKAPHPPAPSPGAAGEGEAEGAAGIVEISIVDWGRGVKVERGRYKCGWSLRPHELTISLTNSRAS
jgi:hypothetical protein